MRRRDFILAGGATVAWPSVARAAAVMPVIGFLHSNSLQGRTHLVAAFNQGLKDTGFVENQNLTIEYGWANGQVDRLQALANDFVRKVAVIAAMGEPAVFAAKAATSTIPIVFVVGADPVKTGLVASLARPGANMTGLNIFSAELQAKRLGLLDQLIPSGLIITDLFDPNFPLVENLIAEVEVAARGLGRQLRFLKVSNESEIDAAFATVSQQRIGGIIVGPSPFFTSRRNQIIALAARYAIPAIYEWRESPVDGGLISYGTNLVEAFHQAGVYTARVLHGEKPADIPVIQPTKFELVINLKTAKTLGLTIPSGVLAIADEVIE
jgi:putative tryptophan/tyrosine transport system substrate-binding protein